MDQRSCMGVVSRTLKRKDDRQWDELHEHFDISVVLRPNS